MVEAKANQHFDGWMVKNRAKIKEQHQLEKSVIDIEKCQIGFKDFETIRSKKYDGPIEI